MRSSSMNGPRNVPSNSKASSAPNPFPLAQAFRTLLDESGATGTSRDFDELFRIIHADVKPIPGIGDLYVYDTSFRIGAKLNLFPTKVYLHAGTQRGVRALGLDHSAATLKVSELPKELRTMEPHELENILCIFKDELKTTSAMPMAEDIVRHIWFS